MLYDISYNELLRLREEEDAEAYEQFCCDRELFLDSDEANEAWDDFVNGCEL